MTGTVSADERIDRATLLRISEPAVQGLVLHVRRVGVRQTLVDIGAGTTIDGVDVGALQHRLADASGERDLEAAAAIGARLVCPGDDEWPSGLEDLGRCCADSFGVWVLGSDSLADVCDRAVAIVGTRVATDYGIRVATDLASGLADRGWTVVSGLAYGIDSAGHRGALASGGTTVAVLACGVDVAYPSGHRHLYDEVAAAGLVVSEHPPGASPQRHRFLVRNRLIASLSLGTVVVEAAARSGARSTARHAGLLNRHVMAVPGPVTSAASAGCHQLLRDRPDAVLVTKADEVIEQVGHLGDLADRVEGPSRARDLLGPVVARVFEGVPVRRSAPAGRIAATVGVNPEATAAALAALEAQGLVERVDGGWGMTTLGRRDRRAVAGPDPDDFLLW